MLKKKKQSLLWIPSPVLDHSRTQMPEIKIEKGASNKNKKAKTKKTGYDADWQKFRNPRKNLGKIFMFLAVLP